MDAIAKGKFLRGSPQKTRLVIDLIRGKNVANALAILQFTNKRATQNIEKCLRSAIANATFKAEQQNVAIDPDDLWVKTCFVDMGPHKNRRRVRPAPQGRAYREQRYYCHITIELTSDKPASLVAKEEKVKAAKINAKARAANKPAAAPTPKTAAPAVTEAPEEIVNSVPVEETSPATQTEETVETAATPTDAPVATETTTATDGETAATTENAAATETEENK